MSPSYVGTGAPLAASYALLRSNSRYMVDFFVYLFSAIFFNTGCLGDSLGYVIAHIHKKKGVCRSVPNSHLQ